MESYDVIIVGGGPAGLRCAAVLAETDLKVLLVEKEHGFGDKVCAGGLTTKDLAILPVPDEIIEHKMTLAGLFSRKRKNISVTTKPLVFTVNRKNLGKWQRDLIKDGTVEVMTRSRVTEIRENSVIINEDQETGFKYLVGADGYNSLVRKHLGFEHKRKLIAIQYLVPRKSGPVQLEIHLHARHFKSWYAWIFPHSDHDVIGCCCDPGMMSAGKLKDNFHLWLKEKSIDISDAVYESAPIAYDYRGLRFGNIFLVGDAGGFASGLTGEGIYQSLVSGETAARMIINPDYSSRSFQEVLKYNRIQIRLMRLFYYCGWLRGAIYEFILITLNNKRIQAKVNRLFG